MWKLPGPWRLLRSSSEGQLTHQRLRGSEETRFEFLVRESTDRFAGGASDLQSSGWRQRQDGFHGCGVAVLTVCQEARLPVVVRDHDVQLWTAGLMSEDDGACSHALHYA